MVTGSFDVPLGVFCVLTTRDLREVVVGVEAGAMSSPMA